MSSVSEKVMLTQRGYDNTQGDQGLVDIGAFRQSIPAVVGICSLTVTHQKARWLSPSSATRGQLC